MHLATSVFLLQLNMIDAVTTLSA